MTETQLRDALFTVFSRWWQVSYPAPASSDQDYVNGYWADQANVQTKPPFVTLKMITGPRKNGWDDFGQRQQTQTLVFSADLVAANVINGNVGSDAIDPLTFDTSHANTLAVLCARLKASGAIESAKVDPLDGRKINISAPVNVSLTGFVVTAGASQPTITVTVVQDDAGMELSGLRHVTLSIQAFGVNRAAGVGSGALRYTAMDILQRIADALELPEFNDDLGKWIISVEGNTDPQNLTDVVETKYEMRAQMDVMLTIPLIRSSSTTFIETADLSGAGDLSGLDLSGP